MMVPVAPNMFDNFDCNGTNSVYPKQQHQTSPFTQIGSVGLLQQVNQLNFAQIQINEDSVDFPAIYQGANLHAKVFVLMTRNHVEELNILYSGLDENRQRAST